MVVVLMVVVVVVVVLMVVLMVVCAKYENKNFTRYPISLCDLLVQTHWNAL